MASVLVPASASAQYAWQETDREPSREQLSRGITYKVEAQASAAKGKTPLWLNANKYGLSSLDNGNGYLRAAVVRPLAQDSARRWAVGYGLDVAVPVNYTSNFIVQQAFAEVRWLHGTITAGAKEYPMELKNKASAPARRHSASTRARCRRCDWPCHNTGNCLSATDGCT